ncbi:hypothetical protein BC938DRAFT_472046 [Jimgerdemannia flammicorona]|uniref:Alpha/Beta hydrolase protein n=1 Tax=Jimgerdemannia flammicorona TaxID=994334 RepID=A0A433Q6W0_9FUNG|nr:hypothetical protein BC938DRAFT_472046 [Jimgerdemannia flammicorona]
MAIPNPFKRTFPYPQGGLDCRYLITHMPSRSYSVRTLTTVSTPHRGSPVMDWFRDHVGVGVVASIADAANKAAEEAGMREPQTSSMELERGKEAVRRVYDSEPRYHADGSRDAKSGNGASHKQDNSRTSSSFSLPFTLPSLPSLHLNPTTLLDPLLSRVVQTLDTPAYSNLTTDYCIGHFNPNTPDVSGVRYYSYGAATQIPIWSLLGFPWEVISEKEGPNDGLVSVRSARWGKYIETVDATHWDLNGSNNMQVFNWFHIYCGIKREVGQIRM